MLQPGELLAIHREGTTLVEMFLECDEDRRRRMTEALRPQDKDFRFVFVPAVAAHAAGAYDAFWAGTPVIATGAAIHARLVLALGVSLWRAIPGFPPEYAHVIPLLRRRNVWACWSYSDDAAVTAAYDGLVRLDDGRWAWFPSPWLFVGDAAVVGRPSPASHWVD
jgi:hypothetical protein